MSFDLQARSEIFPATTGGAATMCSELNVPFLGALPLDPLLARRCDEGLELPTSPAVDALAALVDSEYYT